MGTLGVTGATGFLGHHVARHLADRGWPIVAFGTPSNPGRAFQHDHVEWRIRDLADASPEDFRGVERVVHFAGSHRAEGAHSKNVSMLRVVLEAVSRSPGVTTFYLVSTYAVFGHRATPAGPDAPLAPLDDYARSKAEGERLLREVAQRSAFRGVVVRPCSIYGPGGSGVIDIVRSKLAARERIEVVRGFGNAFLHVSDLSGAIETILASDAPEPAYNIEGERMTGADLKRILDALGARSTLQDAPSRSYWSKGLPVERAFSVEAYLRGAAPGRA